MTEQVDLFQQLVVVVDLRVAGGEHLVPEQRHLLFQRALGGDQVIHVVHVAHRRLAAGQQCRRLMAQQRRRDRPAGASRGSAIPRPSPRSPCRRVLPVRRGWRRSQHAASGAPSGRCHLGTPCFVLLRLRKVYSEPLPRPVFRTPHSERGARSSDPGSDGSSLAVRFASACRERRSIVAVMLQPFRSSYRCSRQPSLRLGYHRAARRHGRTRSPALTTSPLRRNPPRRRKPLGAEKSHASERASSRKLHSWLSSIDSPQYAWTCQARTGNREHLASGPWQEFRAGRL